MLELVILCVAVVSGEAFRCRQPAPALELGEWSAALERLDSAVVQAQPVSTRGGLRLVYENRFPDYLIQYVSVENKALKSCGARAALVDGGLDHHNLVVSFKAEPNQEVRSIVDVWGKQTNTVFTKLKAYFKKLALKNKSKNKS